MFNKDSYLFSQEIATLIIPKEQVTIIDPDCSLERALLVLTRKRLSSVPVINGAGKVEGVISKTNILDFILQLNQQEGDFTGLKEHTVKEAMNKSYLGILANSILSFAFEVLLERSFTPIIDLKGRFIGILTRKVMMEKVVEFFEAEYQRTRDQGMDSGKTREGKNGTIKHKKFFHRRT
ncbi:CBS domain-containing protein [Laceyella putida]|uniref:CBS domain-containing protein n=1 Tax=Laceyella putida TaxID=110101 RepID=A0ABW2RF34_9BACL